MKLVSKYSCCYSMMPNNEDHKSHIRQWKVWGFVNLLNKELTNSVIFGASNTWCPFLCKTEVRWRNVHLLYAILRQWGSEQNNETSLWRWSLDGWQFCCNFVQHFPANILKPRLCRSLWLTSSSLWSQINIFTCSWQLARFIFHQYRDISIGNKAHCNDSWISIHRT